MSNDLTPASPASGGSVSDDAYAAVVPASTLGVTGAAGTAPTGGADSSTKDTAKEQAASVAGDAKDGTQHVAGVTKDEARKVASEAKSQAQDLLAQTRDQLREQTGVQQERAAGSLRTLSDELRDMGDRSESTGLAGELVSQAAQRAGSAASYLEGRDPGTLLQDVTDFARRRPGLFVGLAVVAGVAAGRLTRSLTSEAHDRKAADEATADTSAATTGTAGYVTPAVPTASAHAPTELSADEPIGVGPYDAPATDASTPLYDQTRPVDPLTEAFGAGDRDGSRA
jgi:gas vesicle protein